MVNGFYGIAFTGSHGSGFGIFVFRDGIIAGADLAGATYDGSYRESEPGGNIAVIITMKAPAGIIPVQTGVPLSTSMDLMIETSLSPDFAGGRPLLVETPIGKVNVVFVKVRDVA
jgi:hypothetical protein